MTNVAAAFSRVDDKMGLIFSAIINNLSYGIIIIEAGGQVNIVNRTAEVILAANNGLALSAGKLKASLARTNVIMEEAIARAAKVTSLDAVSCITKFVLVGHSSRQLPYFLMIEPLLAWSPDSRATGLVIVVILDPLMEGRILAGNLAEAFGLTPTELRLVNLIGNGVTIKESAANLEISMNTIRSHLKRIFTKTGVRSQASLALLLNRLSFRFAKSGNN